MLLHWPVFAVLFGPIATMVLVIGGGSLLERLAPAERGQPLRQTWVNAAHGVLANVLRLGLGPMLGIATTAVINASGGGWIALPDHGWSLALAAMAYLLVIDLSEYVFHRLQHAVPALWEMHSFHHSDPAVNVSTAFRNYWLETPIKILFVYPWVAILFRVPSTVLVIYAFSTVWHAVNHLNLRCRSPIPWFLLNNWQFHRIHHSSLKKHWDTNFSPYFPIWDILAGTAYPPAPDEYPPTGLPEERAPETLTESLLWPWRHRVNREPVLDSALPGLAES